MRLNRTTENMSWDFRSLLWVFYCSGCSYMDTCTSQKNKKQKPTTKKQTNPKSLCLIELSHLNTADLYLGTAAIIIKTVTQSTPVNTLNPLHLNTDLISNPEEDVLPFWFVFLVSRAHAISESCSWLQSPLACLLGLRSCIYPDRLLYFKISIVV